MVLIDVNRQFNLYGWFRDAISKLHRGRRGARAVCVCAYREMIEKIIRFANHAEASLCMFNVAICLDNYDLIKHSEHRVRDVRLKTAVKVACVLALHIFARTILRSG